MAPAWLDSLSEEWVSQPRSEESQAQLPELPSSFKSPKNSSIREPSSRIPRLGAAAKHARSRRPSSQVPHDSSFNILSERSQNDVNLPISRGPSKQSRALPNARAPSQSQSQRGRHLVRSASASTDGSVIHNTVHHQSHSASPSKSREDIPEWKRRLVYGELACGEAKDLFSSAETGLGNLFRPPSPPTQFDQAADGQEQDCTANDMTLPSSPPPYRKRFIPQDDDDDDETLDESVLQHGSSLNGPPLSDQGARNDDPFSAANDSSKERTSGNLQYNNHESLAASRSSRFDFDASRKTSGKSEVLNEDFSPILITRHSAEDGKVSYTPLDLPSNELRKRLEKLRDNQMVLNSDPDFENEEDHDDMEKVDEKLDSADELARQGGFINLRRGGRSAEGSFRHRPLSPTVNTDTSEMLPESSLQASTPKNFSTVRTARHASGQSRQAPGSPPSPSVPAAPHPSPEKRLQPPPGHSGSPLKLFGPYDTFTNQTLLRRISQFEEEENDGHEDEEFPAVTPQGSPSRPSTRKGLAGGSSPRRSSRGGQLHRQPSINLNRFGSGRLDDFEFSEDLSMNTTEHSKLADKENVKPSRGPRLSSNPINLRANRSLSFDGDALRVRRQRNPSNSIVTPDLGPERHSIHYPLDYQDTPQRDLSEGKRPRTSPSKDPTPKRRRTLHRSDIAYGLEDRPDMLENVQSVHYNMQAAIGEKRKDARPGERQETASPEILASRDILSPRSPTPSRKTSGSRERQPLADMSIDEDDYQRDSFRDDGDVRVRDFAVDGARKPSMKTQDFFDAAEEIMAMIRNKARPKTSLDSVQESETENVEQRVSSPDFSDDSFQDSFKEPFLRPPSREGRPVPRMPIRQQDPELEERLKKYEETGDAGEMNYSMRSLGQVKEPKSGTVMRPSSPEESPEEEVESDLPNVKLSRNPDRPRTADSADFASNGSRSSGSTGRSFPTGSSQRSDSRRLIAPDVVDQIIGEQVGNMIFDKERKTWTKVKTPKPERKANNTLPSEDSEDDPFASIPDLSVDTAKETENLGLLAEADLDNIQEFLEEPLEDGSPHSRVSGQSLSPGSVRSQSQETLSRIKKTMVETAVEDDKEIEHEITIHENRMQKSSPARRKNLTISFSSPIASVIRDISGLSSIDDEDGGRLGRPIGNIALDSMKRGRQANGPRSVSCSVARTTKSTSRSRSRNGHGTSAKKQGFMPRPVSRIDERDEDQADEHDTTERQLSIRRETALDTVEEHEDHALSTPAPPRTAFDSATPIIGQHVGTYSLSPLSEFTMHHGDRSCALEVSYVVGDEYLVTGDGSRKVLSKAVRSLVEKITEVEPFEPDWETMDELHISNKQLTTLHKLDQFCSNVVTLDASSNSISSLEGVPGAVRNLRMMDNQLSGLTAWGHLQNLQYIDVSNNQIDSLYAFKDLVHLRSLRADNNQITSLDGIKLHDSLQSLRVRNNYIGEVDMDGTKLTRLTDLDLEGNQIAFIDNLEQLPSLATLNVQRNRLGALAPSSEQPMLGLRYIKVSDNQLTHMDASAFPSLRLLHADRNCLGALTGFSRCRRLDSLSLREQRAEGGLDMAFLNSAYEVRKLFLSGNVLRSVKPGEFSLPVDYLNLQLLELSSCGLSTLAPELGQMTPNLRVLNLNFNAVAELTPLRYIPRLKRLLVAGNRLGDAARAADVLSGFPHLTAFDARDNPLTLGFYAPSQTLMASSGGSSVGSAETARTAAVAAARDAEPFALADADAQRDCAFAKRLDPDTRMRRRLHALIVLGRCARLRTLDGLPAPRQDLAARDDVWEALKERGVFADADANFGGERQGEEETPTVEADV